MEKTLNKPVKSFLKKPNIPYLGLCIWTIFTLCLGAFFVETLAVINDPVTSWMNDVEFYLTLSATLINLVCYIIFAHKFIRICFNVPFFVVFLILFICNLVALLLFPTEINATVPRLHSGTLDISYYLPMGDKIRYMFTFGVECIYLYMFFVFFPKVFRNKRAVNIVMHLVIFACLVAIIYSLCVEFNVYSQYNEADLDPAKIKSAVSFTNNRNTFGFYILLGILAAAYLNSNCHRFYYWFFILLFYVEQYFIISKTALIISNVLVIAYVVYRYFRTVKIHAISSSIWLLVLALAIAIISLLIFMPIGDDVRFFRNIKSGFDYAMFGSKSRTLYARLEIWNYSFTSLFDKPTEYLLGIGKGNYGWYFGMIAHSTSVPVEQGFAHNGFVQMFCEGGVVKLLAYVGIIGYMVYISIQNLKSKSRGSTFTLLIMLTILIHGWFESTNFMRVDTVGIVIYAMCFLPALVDYNCAKHPEIEETLIEEAKEIQRSRIYVERTGASSGTLAFVIFAPIAIAFLGTIHGWNLLGFGEAYDSLYVYLGIGIMFLLEPITYFHIGYMGKLRKPIELINFIIVCGCVAVIFAFPDLIGMSIALGVTTLIFLITFGLSLHARRLQKGGYFFYKVYLPYLAICGVLAGFSGLFTVFMDTMYLTKYALVAIALVDVICLICINVYLPTSRRFAYPLSGLMRKFELRYNVYATLKDLKIETREHNYKVPYAQRKPIPKQL